jgi:hypothetical protein
MRSVYLFVAAAVAIAAVSAQKDYNYNNVDYSGELGNLPKKGSAKK